MAHIVVLGAGLGGVPMALEARRELGRDHKITVVSDKDTFHFTLLAETLFFTAQLATSALSEIRSSLPTARPRLLTTSRVRLSLFARIRHAGKPLRCETWTNSKEEEALKLQNNTLLSLSK